MKSKYSKFFLAFVGVTVFLLGLSSQGAQAQDNDSNARLLEGTWTLTVTPNDCNGHPIGTPFPALLTFARGGTLTGVGMPRFILPLQTSPAYGTWTHTGGQTFTSASLGFVTLNGAVTAVQKLTLKTIIIGNDPDHWAVDDAVSEFRDPDNPNHILFSNCASGFAQRFE